jgi:hypothetical protein
VADSRESGNRPSGFIGEFLDHLSFRPLKNDPAS